MNCHTPKIVTAAAIGCLLCTMSAADASHSESFSDFDLNTDFGWSTTDVATRGFWNDGNFLGEFQNETVSLLIMDALPTGPDEEYGDRLVALDFDLLILDNWFGADQSFQVFANGLMIYDESYFGFDLEESHHVAIDFSLIDQFPNGTDIVIEFKGVDIDGDGSWGLDNVLVDWSQPLPAPGALPLLALLGLRSRRTRL